MNLNKTNKYINSFSITVIFTLVFLSIVVGLSNVTAFQGIKFGLYMFFAEGVCGYVIVRLIGVRFDTRIQGMAFSLGFGYCLQIINYYLLIPIGLRFALPWVVLIEVILSVVYLARTRDDSFKFADDNKELLFFGSLLFIAFLFRFIVGFGFSVVSNGNIVNTYIISQDVYYHTENTISANNQFPLTNFRQYVMPNTLYYHYFTNLANSVTTTVCNIPVGSFESHLDLVRGVLLFTLSFYAMMQKICKNHWIKFLVSLLTLFSIGNERATGVNLFGNVFINPFGYDYGVALSTLFLLLALYIFEEKPNIKTTIAEIILCMAATGAKGPVFVVFAAAFAVGVIFFFFKGDKKDKVIVSIFSLAVFIFFVIVFVFVTIDISGNSVDIGTHSLEFNFLQSLKELYVWKYHDLLVSKGVPSFVGVIFTIVIWMFDAKPGLFLLFGFAVVLAIVKRVKVDKEEVVLAMGYVFGCGAAFCLTQSGASERYFSMSGFVIGGFCVAHLMDLVVDKCLVDNPKSKIPFIVTIFMFLCLLPGLKYRDFTCETEIFKRGIDTIFCSSKYQEPGVEVVSSVRKNEMLAYDWIRDNTVFDDICINNIYLADNAERNYTPTVFSERRNWIDGWIFQKTDIEQKIVAHRLEVLMNCLDNDPKAYQEIKSDGVTYLVQIKSISPDFVMDSKYGQVAYQNDEVVVYKLN